MVLKSSHRRQSSFLPSAERLEPRVALSGGIDTSFGSGGRVTIPFNLGGDNNDTAQAVAALPDGKILVAGGADTGTTSTDSALGESAVVVRLNADGSLDTTFGQGGRVILPSPDPRQRLDKITAMAVQPDGAIVVVGTAEASLPPSDSPAGSLVFPGQDFSVARLNPDGSLDSSFGSGGQLLIGFNIGGDNNDTANGVALQPDGNIVVFGVAESGINNSMAAVARLNSDGSLDTSFANGGKLTMNFAFRNTHASTAVGGAIQPDGKIVIFGSAGSPPFSTAMAAARLNANGSLDTSFGSHGVVLVSGSKKGNLVAFSGTMQSDGKIVLAGTQFIAARDVPFVAVRLTGTGSIDHSFHKTGIATANFNRGGVNGDEAHGVVETSTGALVLGGLNWPKPPKFADFGAARLTSSGNLDKSFGKKGFTVIPFDLGGDKDDEAFAVAIQPDGKILLAGYAENKQRNTDFAVTRLLA